MSQTTITNQEDIIDSKHLGDIIQTYWKKPEDKELWRYCNDILYRMCEEQLSHNDKDIIAGKLIIIGRTYAAAVERRKTKDEDGYSNDDFYYKEVTEKMKSIHKELDTQITNLRKYSKPTKANFGEMIYTHKLLTETFHESTGDNKRSLASKYLHFHCKNMFYIYDKRAEDSIKNLVKNNSSLIKSLALDGDKTYVKFAVKCLTIQEFAQKEFGKALTPRDIDNILLDLAENWGSSQNNLFRI